MWRWAFRVDHPEHQSFIRRIYIWPSWRGTDVKKFNSPNECTASENIVVGPRVHYNPLHSSTFCNNYEFMLPFAWLLATGCLTIWLTDSLTGWLVAAATPLNGRRARHLALFPPNDYNVLSIVSSCKSGQPVSQTVRQAGLTDRLRRNPASSPEQRRRSK